MTHLNRRLAATSSAALAAMAVAVLAALPAHAHRQWILASASQSEGEAPYVTFDAAISEDLFEFDHRPMPVGAVTIVTPDGSDAAIENLAAGARRSTFDLKLAQKGTYRVSLVSQSVMGSYVVGGETRRFRGSEADFAKAVPAGATNVEKTRMSGRVETWVTSGRGDVRALTPAGVGLEIVPVSHPSELVADEPATFTALLNGKPVESLNVAIVPGGGRHRGALKDVSATTGPDGKFTVNWPMPGKYWIGASWPPRAPGGSPTGEGGPPPQPSAQPDRFSVAATFEVAPF